MSAELSFVLSQFTRVTDRQADRQDRRLCDRKDRVHTMRVHTMQRGKNRQENNRDRDIVILEGFRADQLSPPGV